MNLSQLKLLAHRAGLPGNVGMMIGSALLPAYKAEHPADLPVTIAPVFPLWLILVLFALGLAATFVQYQVIRPKLDPREPSSSLSFVWVPFCFLSPLLSTPLY